MATTKEKRSASTPGRGSRAWAATFSSDLCSDVHLGSHSSPELARDVKVSHHSLCDSKLHVRDLDRSSSSRTRLQPPVLKLRPKHRVVSLADECKGLKQQIGSQSQALQEARIKLRDTIEYSLSEKNAHSRAEVEIDTLEQQVNNEMDRHAAALAELESSRRQSAEMLQKHAVESLEWSAERNDLLEAVAQVRLEKHCRDAALEEESAALAQASLDRFNLEHALQELSSELHQADLRYKASQECWEKRMTNMSMQAARDQEAAAFEWAMERQARLLGKEDSLKEIKDLKAELNEEVFLNRRDAWRSAGSGVELACQVKSLSEERDSLRLQLSELRRKSAEDYTQLLYFNRVQ